MKSTQADNRLQESSKLTRSCLNWDQDRDNKALYLSEWLLIKPSAAVKLLLALHQNLTNRADLRTLPFYVNRHIFRKTFRKIRSCYDNLKSQEKPISTKQMTKSLKHWELPSRNQKQIKENLKNIVSLFEDRAGPIDKNIRLRHRNSKLLCQNDATLLV